MPSKLNLTRAGRSDLINAIRAFGGQETVADRLRLTTGQHPRGYWHNFSHVAEALRTFIADHGETGVMPTLSRLEEYGHHGLCHAIRQYGGPAIVAERLGLLEVRYRHPDHYWDDFAVLRLAIQEFLEEHGLSGKLPSKKTLTQAGRQDLIGAIRLHGGWRVVARQLGLAEPPPQKPEGYWLTFEHVAQAIQTYNQTHGTPGQMPGQIELNRAGYSSLARAISVYHGGMAEVASRLGLAYNGPRPPGYWQEWSHLEEALQAFIQTSGLPRQMPSMETLAQHNRHDLINAIATHGGYHTVAGRLALTTRYQPPGYWDKWDNLRHEFLEWAREHGYTGVMPTGEELTASGRADLASAVYKHGGLLVVADKLGWRTGQGQHRFLSWADVAVAVQQFIADSGEEGVMPQGTLLLQRGRPDLLRAIYKWGGGLTQAAYRLGLKCTYPRDSQWRLWTHLEQEMRAFLEQLGGPDVLPMMATLRAAGRGDLVNAIQLYHGGAARVAHRLGLRYSREPQRYWQGFGHVAEALFSFLEEHGLSGGIPTHQFLRTHGASSLSQAILNHGGSQRVAEQLGLDYQGKSPGYWRDWETFATAMEKFIREQGQPGVMPTQPQLRQAGRADLEGAIRFHGGMKAVEERGGWQSTRSKPHSRRHAEG